MIWIAVLIGIVSLVIVSYFTTKKKSPEELREEAKKRQEETKRVQEKTFKAAYAKAKGGALLGSFEESDAPQTTKTDNNQPQREPRGYEVYLSQESFRQILQKESSQNVSDSPKKPVKHSISKGVKKSTTRKSKTASK